MSTKNVSNSESIPKDGLAGFKENFIADAISGFSVFLLALPLSLGIAKASEFPPVMGLVTAIIGGIVVSFFAGSRLTIKGPAAGLIVIVAGAVNEYGGGEQGWHIALGAMVVASIIQILFGLFKWGKLVDFFPISAIHGMLAAIGIIIIAKQIPVLLNIDPSMTKGKGPFALIGEIPNFIAHMDPRATLIGVVSLAIMLFWPYIKNVKIKMIPAPLVVLLLAIPAEVYMDFQATEPVYSLVHIGNFLSNIHWNVNFEGIGHIGIFIKYIVMFALVGSLESLLTLKAIDLRDPFHRKSDANKDLIAVGIGNTLAACLGGLPMISEVARSSANVANGAKTRWANLFHGLFILLFVLFAMPLIELIPNCALAAMLISVGIRLAHPKEFIHTYHIGVEQLAIFITTIFFTLYEDLLVGIAAGMLLKLIIHIIKGAPISALFKAPITINQNDADNNVEVTIEKAAIFSNYIGIKKQLEEIPQGKNVKIDLSNTALVDHSVMENLQHFKRDYTKNGGTVSIDGLDNHETASNHELAARKNTNFTK
jgi:MFS superfamily sulfate permease-like transporter